MLPARVPPEEYGLMAEAIGCRPDLLRGLSIQESAEDPSALRRESAHWRKRRFASKAAKRWDRAPNPRSMEARWEQFREMDAICQADAMLNPRAGDAAILCHSFGWCQIMGFNHRICGFEDPRAFLGAMQTLDGQRRAFVNFVKASEPLRAAFRHENLQQIAFHYNGPAYDRNKYDRKLAEHVSRLRNGGSAYA